MASVKALEREIEALRARASDLNAAILRIGASLDVETVLNEVVEAARALTPARYGAITTVDENGRLDDFLAAGFAPEELRRLKEWPGGPHLFEHLRDLEAPLRLADFGAWIGSLGLSPEPLPGTTLQVTPVRYRGQYLGAVFLSDKEGGEQFTDEDEEILVLLASQAATAIANARAYRADLERARTEFLSLVSHELRTPLAAIKGSSASALSTTRMLEPAEASQFFRIIDEQADRMDGLLSDLLDAGRIDAGTLSLQTRSAEVAVLVDQARNTFLGGGGRHALEIDLPPDLPRVMADEPRIVQVLNNLVSNAARRSPATTPIRIDAARDGLHVAIAVSDEGRGVPPEVLPRLFHKYAGAGGDGGPARGGYGLGLAICKGLVEAHGGRIHAASGGTGRGARFTFTLPVAAEADDAESARPAASRPNLAEDPGGRARILVLDDDPHTLRHARDALMAAGYAPLVTADPDDLSRLLRTEKPELVLLDLMLPGADGIELMERVPGLAELPVIFISGYGRDETISRALEAGAADYIVKPFSPTELAARVRAALRLRARPTSFVLGDLAINYDRRRVSLAGRLLELTVTEYELLYVLSRHAGKVVTHATLFRQVWGDRHADSATAARTYVKKLRSKLGDDALRPTYILNERGVGYRMPAPSDA